MFDINKIIHNAGASVSDKIMELARIFKIPADYQLTEDISRIRVHEVISKLAFIYEKIRNTIDYRDEHLFRIYAILRILKRRIFFEEQKKNHGENLIKELIRGGYLDNDKLPEIKIGEVDTIIEKYIKLISLLSQAKHKKGKKHLTDFLMTLAAGEIEENLVPNQDQKIQALVNLMYAVIKERIVLTDAVLAENEMDTQIFIACHRALTKADSTVLNYELFKHYYPDWAGLTTPDSLINDVAANLSEVKNNIEHRLNHPAGGKFFLVAQKEAAPYVILGDIFSKYPDQIEKILFSPESFEKYVKDAANERYKKIRAVLNRSAWRSVIYVFITKVFLAFVLEVPYDYYLSHHLYLPALGISIIVPPILMFIMVSSVKIPREKNTAEIIRELKQLVYTPTGGQPQYSKIKISIQRSLFLKIIFGIFNLALFIISFGIIIWITTKLNFSIFSQIIFLIFLTAISFFAIQIRRSADQILAVEKKQNIFGLIADLFGFPLLQVGQWLSYQFRFINLFGFIFDIFIETPLKSFIVISEKWAEYLKERKEQIGKPQ